MFILGGGLTPAGQTIYKVIKKVFKGYFFDLFDDYIITELIETNGSPKDPTRQLFTTWIVKAWDMISPDLVRKLWTACGYLA